MAGRARSPGSWCSGITSASHAEGPGFKAQWVHSLPASPVCHQQQFFNLPSTSPASKKKPITQGRQQPRTQARKPYVQTQCPAHAHAQHAMRATQPSPRKTRQLGQLNQLSVLKQLIETINKVKLIKPMKPIRARPIEQLQASKPTKPTKLI